MSETPHATLNGFRLLNSSPVQWVMTEGVQPHVATFDIMAEDVGPIMAQAKDPQTLIIDNKNGQKINVEYLSLLYQVPSDNPHVKRIAVADRRWILPYFNFLGRFNMRRNVGYQRVKNNITPQLNPVVADVWYWPWSLDPQTQKPYKASKIVDEFMKQLQLFEENEGYPALGYSLNSQLKFMDDRINVDNMNLDESGDMCLARLLGMYPAVGIYVGLDGRYMFYDRLDKGEDKAVEKLGPLVVGRGQFLKADRKYVRPNRIEVFFSMEVEVRHDFIGEGGTVTADTRYLENVAPVPDFELTVGGQTLCQNTWYGITAMMAAWGNAPGINRPLDGQLMEKAAIPFLDLWGALLLTGATTPDADWAARVAILQQHWRRTFQLESRWMMRTLSIKARRAAVINPTTGTWAPSEVFCDHSFIGTQRSFFKNLQSGNRLSYAMNVEGYPQGGAVPGQSTPGGVKAFTATSKAAPVLVQVLDGDQGVIHFNFQADPNHMYEAALPGLVARANNTLYPPVSNWKNPDENPVGFDMVTSRAQIPKLKNQWKAAVILSHVPASPNNKRQLYKITVMPEDVSSRLGGPVGECLGPTWQIRVGAGMDGAKAIVRWFDERAPDIEAIFGIGDKDPNLEGLVANHRSTDIRGVEQISLLSVAEALAAQVYSRYIDGQEGVGVGIMNPEIAPDGRIAAVTHTLTSRGEVLTELQMQEQAPEVPFLSLLDSSTRAILLKLPHVERQ